MNATYDEERRLVDRYLESDRDAADAIIRRCEPTITAVVRHPRWRFNDDVRDEVLQTARTAILDSLKTFEFQSLLKTFAGTIAYRCCVAEVRRQRAANPKSNPVTVPLTAAPKKSNPGPSDPSEQPDPSERPDDLLARLQEWSRVKELVERLEASCKELIRLRFFDDLAFDEIAERLKAKRNTVMVRLGRCLDKLRGLVLEEV
jgi:RNA polymerase sigma factor (sigma-70 family)